MEQKGVPVEQKMCDGKATLSLLRLTCSDVDIDSFIVGRAAAHLGLAYQWLHLLQVHCSVSAFDNTSID